VLTVTDILRHGLRRLPSSRSSAPTERHRLRLHSFDMRLLDGRFSVPGTGCPSPGLLAARGPEVLLELIVAPCAVCGLEVVEVSPPYDIST